MARECPEFLQRFLPRLRLRWSGYRKVHRQVCKRLHSRINELGLHDLQTYEQYFNDHAEEWSTLDSLCRITISRFYRDRSVFEALRSKILPVLADQALKQRSREIRCWCAGCCSGEEVYTLQILWNLSVLPAIGQDLPLRIIATDIDEGLIQRSRTGSYQYSSLRPLPPELIDSAFDRRETSYSIRELFTKDIEFRQQDIRETMPDGPFHLIFCRNLVFTYFDEGLQRELLEKIVRRLAVGGLLVIGIHEAIPQGESSIVLLNDTRCIYQKTTGGDERRTAHETIIQMPSQSTHGKRMRDAHPAVTAKWNSRTSTGAQNGSN